MASSFPDFLERDAEETRAITKTKLHRTQKEGELAGTVSHKYYKGKYDQNNNKTIELNDCPAIVLKTGKPKKEGGAATKYKAPIVTVGRLESLTPIKDTCELTGDGRYKVIATVQYMKNSNSGDEKLFKDWAKENCKALYDEHDQKFDERFRSQFKNYISPDGKIVEKTFVRLSPNSDITLKCPDDGAKSIFRQTLDHSKIKKVRRRTKLNLTNITVVAWVYMKKIDGESKDGAQLWAPRVSYWLKPGKVELAPGEERYKSDAAKMRDDLSHVDKHFMAHPPDVDAGKVKIPSSVTLLVRNNYSTAIPVQNAKQMGISLKIDPAEKPEDVIYTDQEQNKIKLISRDLTIFQWNKSPAEGVEKYRVQLKGRRDNGKMAEKYGIIDPDTFGLIMFAHHDVTHHAIVSLWWGPTFKNTPDNTEEALTLAKRNAVRDGHIPCSGFYTYGYEDIIPDYYLYFEEDNGAIQISREMCAELFDEYVGTVKRTGATQLTLRNMEAVNPINADGPQSEVLLLGRPDYPCYNGDAWPAVSNGRVYVMTSHILNKDERYGKPIYEDKEFQDEETGETITKPILVGHGTPICGKNADLKAADERFRELLQVPGFTYMVFVVQAGEDNTTPPITTQKKKKKKKKKPIVEVEEEEEEEDMPEVEPMDISEELEDPFAEEEEEEEEEPSSEKEEKKKKKPQSKKSVVKRKALKKTIDKKKKKKKPKTEDSE